MFKFTEILKTIENRQHTTALGKPVDSGTPTAVAGDEQTDALISQLTDSARADKQGLMELQGVELDSHHQALEEVISLEGTDSVASRLPESEPDDSPPPDIGALLEEISDSQQDDQPLQAQEPLMPEPTPEPPGQDEEENPQAEAQAEQYNSDVPQDDLLEGEDQGPAPDFVPDASEEAPGAMSEINALLSEDTDELGSEIDTSEEEMADAISNIGAEEQNPAEQPPESAESTEPEPEPELGDLLSEVAELVETGKQDSSTPEDEVSLDQAQMNVQEAARILNIDETAPQPARGDSEVPHGELMEQVRRETTRLSENLDKPDETTGGAPVAATAAGLAAKQNAVPLQAPKKGFRGVVARAMEILNYPFEVFHVSDNTRNAIGYGALILALVFLVMLLVLFVFDQFHSFI